MTQNQDVKDATMLAENIEEIEKEFDTDNSKKKFPLQKPIIIALCIFVVALIGYFVLLLNTPTIEGTWLHESEDGNKYYYTIKETKTGYTLDVSLGTIYWPGFCSVDYSGEKKALNISNKAESTIYEDAVFGKYTYEISGNRFSENATLILTDKDGKKVNLKKVKEPVISDYVKPYEDSKINQNLIGTWRNYNDMYNTETKVTFEENGVLTWDYYGIEQQKFYYTIEDSVVLAKLFANEEYEYQIDFQIKENGVLIDGLLFTKVNDK